MNTILNRLPGIGTELTAAYRNIWIDREGRLTLRAMRTIDGTNSRDPLNTGDIAVLRAGLLMGKITASGKYAPSVIGVTTVAYDASAALTQITVSAATATELVRRVGASGTFTLTGPDVAAGTVRSATITYSAVNTTTGVITVTDIVEDVSPVASIAETTAGVAAVSGVNDVQTMTFQAGADGGTFALRYRGKNTADLAFNIATADLQTAVRALHADLATTVVSTVGGVGVDYVFTTANKTCSDIDITRDMILDGAVLEPASLVHTTQGVTPVTGVSEVQTVTMSAKGGTWRIGYAGQWTDELAYNISTANLQTALVALSTIGAGNVTVTGTAGASYVLTFGTGLANTAMAMLDLDASNLVTYPGDFIAGSFVQPTDGSQTILGIFDKADGQKVTDDDGNSLDTQMKDLVIGGGVIDASQIINYPSNAMLVAYVKAALRAVGGPYRFDDDF